MSERKSDQPGALRAPPTSPEAHGGLCLSAGHMLGGLTLQAVAHEGPVSTIYRATDRATGQVHAIKEYLPRHLVARQADGSLRPLTRESALNFARGLQAFRDEARLVMSVSHPALVKIQHLWEYGGSTYTVMPWLTGSVLQDWLADLGTPPSEDWVRNMLRPLMQALEALHRKGGCHGGLNMHSIWLQFDNKAQSYLLQQSQPVLLGCSLAARALQKVNPDLHATSGPNGFGPVEQFDGDIHARMGAWTDVYGLCAVTYAALFGRPPPPSMARMARDELVSARKLGRGRYGAALLTAIDAGLVVKPQHRLQSIAALRELMDDGLPAQALRAGKAGDARAAASAPASAASSVSMPMGLAELPPPPPWPGLGGSWWAWSVGLGVLLLALALLGQLLQS